MNELIENELIKVMGILSMLESEKNTRQNELIASAREGILNIIKLCSQTNRADF